MPRFIRRIRLGAGLALPLVVFGVAACGSSKSSSTAGSSAGSSSSSAGATAPAGQTLSMSISESGGKATYTTPSSAKGGLVTVTLKNQGKAPHAAQLVLIKGNHTVAQALKQIQGSSNKTPAWLRGEGGVGQTPPGQTGTATVNLPAGKYAVTELGGPGSSAPPAVSQLQVSQGNSGPLPATQTTVTAATAGKDRYKWQISGALAAGSQRVTFASKGKGTLHQISAVRITANPSNATIIKGLGGRGRPPAFVNLATLTQGTVLDSGKAQVADLTLTQPGTYVLFCPLSDRDGGKPHFAEGLLTKVTVK